MSYDLYTEHQQVREQTNKLPQTPKTEAQIQSQFEDLLQALHFLNKPDIVPRVSIDPEDDHSLNRSSPFCQQCESLENHLKREEEENRKLKEQIRQLKTERNRRSRLEEECKNLQEKLNENELRLQQQNSEFSREIEKLRKQPAYNDTVFYELQELQNRNRKLERQLIENIPLESLETEDVVRLRKEHKILQRAYHGLEKTYSRDMKTLTEKYTTVLAKSSALKIELERLKLGNSKYQNHSLEGTMHLQELEGNIYSLEAKLAKQLQLNDQLRGALKSGAPQTDSCLNQTCVRPRKRPLSRKRNLTPSTCSKTPKRFLRN